MYTMVHQLLVELAEEIGVKLQLTYINYSKIDTQFL